MDGYDILDLFLELRHDILAGNSTPYGKSVSRAQWIYGLMADPDITDRTFLHILSDLVNAADED